MGASGARHAAANGGGRRRSTAAAAGSIRAGVVPVSAFVVQPALPCPSPNIHIKKAASQAGCNAWRSRHAGGSSCCDAAVDNDRPAVCCHLLRPWLAKEHTRQDVWHAPTAVRAQPTQAVRPVATAPQLAHPPHLLNLPSSDSMQRHNTHIIQKGQKVNRLSQGRGAAALSETVGAGVEGDWSGAPSAGQR